MLVLENIKIVKETEKAYLVVPVDVFDVGPQWFPKSQIRLAVGTVDSEGETWTIQLSDWITMRPDKREWLLAFNAALTAAKSKANGDLAEWVIAQTNKGFEKREGGESKPRTILGKLTQEVLAPTKSRANKTGRKIALD